MLLTKFREDDTAVQAGEPMTAQSEALICGAAPL